MIPVRKPGRPLSACSCAPGRTCACGGLRVAIPKKQKCVCPAGAAKESSRSEKKQPPAEAPASPSGSSSRASKSNSGSDSGSGKQSFESTDSERTDSKSLKWPTPDQNGATDGMSLAGAASLVGSQAGLPFDPANSGAVNTNTISIMATPSIHGTNGMSMTHAAGLAGSQGGLGGFAPGIGLAPAGHGIAYASPQNPSYGPRMAYDMGLSYAQPTQLQHEIKVENAGFAQAANGNFGAVLPPLAYATPPISTPPQQPMLGRSIMPKLNSITPGGGGCCGTTPETSSSSNSAVMPQHGYGQSYMPQFPSPVEMSPQEMHSFQYPTVFTYPADYGSWQHPVSPAIWQQVISQTSMSANTPVSPTANAETGGAGTIFQCSCGESCQCIGCLAHPFNSQMFQYVNNAYSGSGVSSPRAGTAGLSAVEASGGQAQTTAAGQDHAPETTAKTPSEGSPTLEEQSLPPMDYFFVNMPISGICGGSYESCPCGDSCECPGCLVHNVPL